MENGSIGGTPIGPIPLTPLKLKLRELLWHLGDKRCHWCGRETLLCVKPVFNQATVNHVVPRWRGGPTRPDNCVSACFACNNKRNLDDQSRLDHPSNKPSEKEILRRSRDEAVCELQIQREVNAALSSRLQELEQTSLWIFLRGKFTKAIRSAFLRSVGSTKRNELP